MIKCVLFDLDGVLLDAKEIHYKALNDALEEVSSFKISREDHLNIYDGLPTRIKLDLLLQKKLIEKKDIPKIRTEKQKYTIKFIEKDIDKNINHIELISWLKSFSFKLGVCTNSVRETLDVSLKKMKLEEFFDIKLSNQDVKNPKPNSEIYEKAMSELDVNPNETLIIEDNFNGIKAAKDSGAFCFEVKTIEDVNLTNITNFIKEINNDSQ